MIHAAKTISSAISHKEQDGKMKDEYKVKNGSLKELEEICALEAACFPKAEAAGKDRFKTRLEAHPECFWLLYKGKKLVSMVNGMASDKEDLTDDMYAGAELYEKKGRWLMIFGVETLPEYQHSGLAGMVMERVIEDSRAVGRKGIVLTCKEERLGFYDRFGFVNEGISSSTHGGAAWYQMRLVFTYNFFAAISRMKYIERWALMRNSRAENLSEHSMEVAMIAHALCVIGNARYGKKLNADRAAVIGIYHDASEIITGDMPTPVKYYNEKIKTAYKQVEAVAQYGLLNKLPKDLRKVYEPVFRQPENKDEIYMKKLVKAADKISALIKCIDEENAGNREFKDARISTEKTVKLLAKELPEVGDFIEEFLPPYGKTLDELEK